MKLLFVELYQMKNIIVVIQEGCNNILFCTFQTETQNEFTISMVHVPWQLHNSSFF